MTIRGERAITRVFDAPSTASRFTDESALDSSRVITELDNNSAHLCEESVRHLVTDAGFALTSLGTNDYVGYVGGASLDVTIPSADQVDHVWQEIGWDNVVARRYGPFCLTPDVGERPVSARPRSVRVVVEVDVPSVSGNAGFACALTRSSSPTEIIDGRYIAAGEDVGITAGVTTFRFDLDPEANSVVSDTSWPLARQIPSAPTGGAGSTGATSTGVRQFYLWVGFSVWDIGSATIEVLSVSAYETRE